MATLKVRGAIDPGLWGACAVRISGLDRITVYDRLQDAGFLRLAEADQLPGLVVVDTPVRTFLSGKKTKSGAAQKKSTYRPERMLEFLRCFMPPAGATWDVHWALEALSPRGGEMPNHSQTAGIGWGLWWMALVACECPIKLAWASAWKQIMFRGHPEFERPEKLPKGVTGAEKLRLQGQRSKVLKTNARLLAQKLYPVHVDLFRMVKHEGRADAALLAAWLSTLPPSELGGGPLAPEEDE